MEQDSQDNLHEWLQKEAQGDTELGFLLQEREQLFAAGNQERADQPANVERMRELNQEISKRKAELGINPLQQP